MNNNTPETDISKITDKLYIAARPRSHSREMLLDLNVGLIISMILQSPDKDLGRPPLRIRRFFTIDSPITPIPMKTLMRGTVDALETMGEGKSVVVYCKRGVHRSVAMASAILIGMGYSADDAIELVKSKRIKANPNTYYIKSRIYRFEKVWKESSKLNTQ